VRNIAATTTKKKPDYTVTPNQTVPYLRVHLEMRELVPPHRTRLVYVQEDADQIQCVNLHDVLCEAT
jgi:hypothetical protein